MSPRPWKHVPSDYDLGPHIADANGQMICRCGGTAPEDAIVMTAAPEMLESCEEALALIEDTYAWKEGPGIALIDKLKRLISKAKGEQP